MITHQMRNILAQLSQDVALKGITWYPMGVVPPVMCGNMTILAERFAIRFKMAKAAICSIPYMGPRVYRDPARVQSD